MINVIIPCYNSRETLPDTLNSLVAQTQKRFIVTVVDDCSKDRIDDIIDEYESSLSINLLSLKENSGSGVARQAGLDANQMCDYILFLDSDDMLMPQAIEVLNRESQKNRPDILVSSFIQHNRYGENVEVAPERATTWVHGKLYRNAFLVENNIRFPEGLRINEDGAFNTMAFGLAKNIYKLPAVTTLWVDNKESLTRKDKDFYITCLPSYIEGQIYAFNFLLDKAKENEMNMSISEGLVYIYNYHQVLLSNNFNLEERIKEKLENFIKRLGSLNYFTDKESLTKMAKCLLKEKNSANYLYFDQYTFKDWVALFGVTIEKNCFNS